MSSIRKTIIANGVEHHIQIDSSLELEEVEITGSDMESGRTIHVSLSSLLKGKASDANISNMGEVSLSGAGEAVSALDMFDADEADRSVRSSTPKLGSRQSSEYPTQFEDDVSPETEQKPAEENYLGGSESSSSIFGNVEEPVKKVVEKKDEEDDKEVINDLFD